MVMSTDGGTVTTRVTDGDGNSLPDVDVVLMPDESNTVIKLSHSQQMRSGTTDQHGLDVYSSLAPGKYHLLALTRRYLATEEDYGKLLRARIKATEVEVGAKGSVQVTVHPFPSTGHSPRTVRESD